MVELGGAIVDYSDREKLEEWLRAQPREISAFIAARAALRVLPLLRGVLNKRFTGGHNADDVVLAFFRAVAVPLLVGTWPRREPEVALAADAAAAAADSADEGIGRVNSATPVTYASNAASNAAYVIYGVDYASFGSYAVLFATFVTENLSKKTDEAIRLAFDQDIEAVQNKSSLANRVLWPNSDLMPKDLSKRWMELKRFLENRELGWEVWTDWYEARLRGDPSNEELELARVLIPNEIWDQGAAVANAEIRRLIEAHRQPTIDAADPEFAPISGATISVEFRKGRLEAAARTAKPARLDFAEGLLEEVRQAATDLRDSLDGNRENLVLRRMAERLADVVSRPSVDVDIGRLTALLRLLRAQAAMHEGLGSDRQDELAGQLSGTADMVSDFLALDPATLELETSLAAVGIAEIADIEPLARAVDEAIRVSEASPVVGASVPTALRLGDPETLLIDEIIGSASATLPAQVKARAQRNKVVAQRLLVLRELAAAALRQTGREMGQVGGDTWDAVKAEIPKSVAKAVGSTVEGSVRVGLVMLVSQLGDPLATVAALSPIFEVIAKRATAIKDWMGRG